MASQSHLLLLIVLLCTGCGEVEEPAAPGVDGIIDLRWWDTKAGGGAPALMRARGVKQIDGGFDRLDFSRVVLRLPNASGVAMISAPRAKYRAKQLISVRLDNGDDQRDVEGAVRFLVSHDGQPIVGRARCAEYDREMRILTLTSVEVVREGQRQWLAWVTLGEDGPKAWGEVKALPPMPALTSAIAALPLPLELPVVEKPVLGR